MNKAYEVADRLMEWVSSLLHRITGESSPVWDRIVYGILVFCDRYCGCKDFENDCYLCDSSDYKI